MEPDVNALLPVVYDHLHALARRMHQERNESLHPSSVVHEAYLRLQHNEGLEWRSEAHFLAIAAKAMRHVIADRVRARNRVKRGGPDVEHVTLSGLASDGDALEDVLAVDQALTELEAIDPRRAEIVQMRVLAGMTCAEIAAVREVSVRTVERDWRAAKAWFVSRLQAL